jgi:ubiquinone/menaquinone biosynthesis C-methylase UbiE
MSFGRAAADRLHFWESFMSKAGVAAYFDSLAPSWEHWREVNRFYHQQLARLVQGMVPPGAKVLELGSGTGDL